MTRNHTKPIKLTAIMALLVLLAIGTNQVFGDDTIDRFIFEYGELLDGVAAEISSIQGIIVPALDTTDSLPTETIVENSSYLDAFDEVIRSQIL